MRNIVYYVAISLDGFIAGRGDEIQGFVADGNGVSKYMDDLKEFDTVIMGRRTYEFGYKFGLLPGQPPYPQMKHYIFSNSLRFETQHKDVIVCPRDIEIIKWLKREQGPDIYLCGGGEFAGWLLDNEQIDILKIKLNPLILGDGISLFGDCKKTVMTELVASSVYDKGLQIMTYKIIY